MHARDALGTWKTQLAAPVRPWLLSLGSIGGMTPFRLFVASGLILLPVSAILGTPILTPVFASYVIGITLYLIRRQDREVHELGHLLDPEDIAPSDVTQLLWTHPRGILLAAWVLGPLVMLVVNVPGGRVSEILSGARTGLPQIWNLGVATFFWVIFLQLMAILLRNAWVFHRLGARHVRIDLLDVRSLTPFTRVAIRNLLIFMGGLTLAPLQLLIAPSYVPQVAFAMLLTLPFCVALVALPIWAIHQRLVQTKRREFDRVQRAIRGDREALIDTAIEEDADTVTVMNLVLYRNMIRGISEWPVDAPAIIRFLSYVLIPLLAWVGAALVEQWVGVLF